MKQTGGQLRRPPAKGTSKLWFSLVLFDCTEQREGKSALKEAGAAPLKSADSKFTFIDLRAKTGLKYL